MLRLKKLTIHRFKGLHGKSFEFTSGETTLAGKNGTGKSTVMDAFMWLLTGKDSHGRADFQIKTINEDGSITPQLDYSVEAEMEFKGQPLEVRKTYREKWVKKRGATEAEFSGHETIYEWNDTPIPMKEYMKRVEEMFSEDVFRLITSPTEFTSLHWKDQRNILFEIAEVSDNDLLDKPEYKELKTLVERKSLDDLRKEMLSKIKKTKDEMALIPPRIDEVKSGMPENRKWETLEAERDRLEKEIEELDEQIENKAKSYEKQHEEQGKIWEEVSVLKAKMRDLQYKAEQKVIDRQRRKIDAQERNRAKVEELTEKGAKIKNALPTLKSERDAIKEEIERLRKEWHSLNEKELTWDEDEFSCPTCKRPLEQDEIDEKVATMTEAFNTDKAKRMGRIKEEGMSRAKELEEVEEKIKDYKRQINTLASEVRTAKEKVEEMGEEVEEMQPEFPSEYFELEKKVGELETKANTEFKAPDTSETKAKRKEKADALKVVEKHLDGKYLRMKAEKRIEELKAQQKEYAQKQAEMEKVLAGLEQYMRDKVEHTESRVNSLFDHVEFKLFDEQVNGAIVETCVATVDGVPYPSLNTASKIRAGIDIINTLCTYYDTSAPIFIDNRESVTEIPETDSQIINLFVSPEHEELTTINIY